MFHQLMKYRAILRKKILLIIQCAVVDPTGDEIDLILSYRAVERHASVLRLGFNSFCKRFGGSILTKIVSARYTIVTSTDSTIFFHDWLYVI